MKSLIALLVAGFASLSAPQQNDFQQMTGLTGGTWVMKTKKGSICERWRKVTDTEMREKGFRVTGSDTSWNEEVRLILTAGKVYYIPVVKDQNGGQPVSFALSGVQGRQFTFSNPQHDYPQIIVYDLISKDSVHAWIDGKIDGKDKKIDYYYRREP